MAKKTNLKFWVLISVFFVSIVCKTAAGVVIYVDGSVSASGDGSTWGTAYKYLQDGLDDIICTEGDVWRRQVQRLPEQGSLYACVIGNNKER